MRVVRKNVFETNSSSTHSLSIEYEQVNDFLVHNLPRVPKENGVQYINIQRINLIKDGLAYGEVDKLRIVVSLICEMIYDEYRKSLREDWEKKNPDKKYNWNEYYQYYDKKSKQKGTLRYFLEHKYWTYLNSLLKEKCNIKIELKPLFDYPPYISEFVDTNLGCESSGYYRSIGLNPGLSKERFKKVLNDVIFNSEIVIYQETYGRND